jgi:hypothetical protein
MGSTRRRRQRRQRKTRRMRMRMRGGGLGIDSMRVPTEAYTPPNPRGSDLGGVGE